MRRTDGDLVVIALAVLAAIAFMWLSAAGTTPAKSDSVRSWTPLATSAFLPLDPLVRPIHSPLAPTPVVSPRPAVRSSAPPTSKPGSTPRGGIGTAVGSVKGTATFYAYHPGQAAAGARLRDAIGPNWRGRLVEVRYGKRKPIYVVLTDFESSKIRGRTIDLDDSDFATLAGPGWYQRGVLSVTVTW